MSKMFVEKKVIVQNVENFMKKSHSLVCRKFYENKVYSTVCRKFSSKKVIVQNVENVMKIKSQYSMSKMFIDKKISQYSMSKISIKKK